MNGLIKTKNKIVLSVLLPLLLSLITTALAPIAVRAIDNPFTLTVGQRVNAPFFPADTECTYTVKPLDPENPMPPGSTADGRTFTITGGGKAEIGPFGYNRPGIYRYDIFQVIEAEKPGYTFDRRIYTAEVHVDAALGANLIILNADGTKTDSIMFENSYNALPSDPGLMVDPPVKKTVSGSPDKDSVFTFKLAARDNASPMPAGSASGQKTLQIVGAGEGEFGTWRYTKAGTYQYEISEVNTGERGYTYDTAVYTITDTVRDENGQLVLSRTVTDNKKQPAAACVFVNQYSAAGKPNVNGPGTGDDSHIVFYWTLFLSAIAAAAAAVIYLITNKKRKSNHNYNNL